MAKSKESSVILMRDAVVAFPELYLEVFVAGDEYEEQAFAQMFCRAECTKALSPDKADLVVFTGGSDVNPALYGEKPHPSTRFNEKRDEEDSKLFDFCVEHGIPMLGVCRGMQFGWVKRGGKLYQDIDGHNGDHGMYDIVNNLNLARVSSVHHQAVVAGTVKGAEVLADVYVSNKRWLNDKDCDTDKKVADIEAVFLPDVCFLGFQGHPEYRNYVRYTEWCLQQIMENIVVNPDVELIGGFRRIKPSLRVSNEVNKTWKELA